MEMIKQVWNASILGRVIGALCSWFVREEK